MLKILKLFIIFIAFTQLVQRLEANPVEPETYTYFDDELREFMEFLRLQMKCGYEPAGVPPLAPYHSAYKQFKFGNGAWSFDGNFTELTVHGLDEFEVRDLRWNNVKRKLTFDFNFEQLLIQSAGFQMDLFAKVFGAPAHVYGDGAFNMELHNLRMHGSFKLQPRLSGGISVVAFNVTVDLEAVKSRTTGVMNSKLYTKLFNSWVEEFVQIIFDDNPEAVSAYVENLMVPPMNKALKNVSMIELVAIILGLAGEITPNEAFC